VDALAPIPPDRTDHLVLGSRLTAEIQLDAYRAMTVPRSAVLQDGKGSYLFRVVDGRARRVDVTTRLETDRWVVVEGKLQPGDIIVSAGNYELREGMVVRDGG